MNSAMSASEDDWPAVLQHLRNLDGTAVTSGSALKVLASSVQWERGLECLVFLQRRGTLNSVAVTIACQLAGFAPKASGVVDEMLNRLEARGLQVSRRCGNAALAQSSWPIAMRQLQGQAKNLPPNQVSYNTVSSHMADAGCWLQVVHLLAQRRQGLRLDVMGCGSGITACATCLAPLWHVALALMSSMQHSLIGAEVMNYNSLLSALRHGGLWRRAVLPKPPDTVTLGGLLAAHLDQSHWYRAIWCLSWAAARRLETDAPGIEAVATGCSRANQWPKALALGAPQGLPWQAALSLPRLEGLDVIMNVMQACLMDAEDASWSRALALCPATDDAPLLALKLNAFQVGMHTVAALATLVLLQKAGLRHVKSLLPRMR
eukprot:g5038.t1